MCVNFYGTAHARVARQRKCAKYPAKLTGNGGTYGWTISDGGSTYDGGATAVIRQALQRLQVLCRDHQLNILLPVLRDGGQAQTLPTGEGLHSEKGEEEEWMN